MRTWSWFTGLGVVAMLAIEGCASPAFYRINHVHSDANQKEIEQAVQAFEQFTSARTGLDPILLKNLEASATLRRMVADANGKLHESLAATALTDESWIALRRRLLTELGFAKPETAVKLSELSETERKCLETIGAFQSRLIRQPTKEEGDCLKSDLVTKVQNRLADVADQIDGQGKTELNKRIDRRIVRVHAIAKVLETLIAGQTALVEQAKEDIVGKPQEDTPGQIIGGPAGFAAAVLSFGKAVQDSGRQAATNRKDSLKAEAIERALFDEAEKSRDPASAYALAALVRTGLRDSDFELLDDVIMRLTANIPVVVKTADDAKENNHGHVPKAWTEFYDNLRNLEKYLTAANTTALMKDVREATRLLGVAGTPFGDALDRAATELSGAMTRYSTSVTGLKAAVDESGISKFLESGAPPDVSTAVNFLTKALGGTSRVAKNGATSDKKLENLAKAISDLSKDITDEQTAAKQRVTAFVTALRNLQLDLHEELLRHYEAMSAVAARDIKRWTLLAKLDRYYGGVFHQEPSKKSGTEQGIFDLFASSNEVIQWYTSYGKEQRPDTPGYKEALPCQKLDGSCSPDKLHPPIDKGDLILPSIRRLAETAAAWQQASPNKEDPLGRQAQLSSQRLWSAAKTIGAHLLMFSVNQAMADDNAIRLATEIGEHDLHVGAILARGYEAEFNLALGDLQAFHSSGITTGDIQNVIGIVQNALLAYIGGKI